MMLLDKLDQSRKKFIKEEFAILMLLLIMVSIFLSRPEVIGYASTNIHSQPLRVTIDQSQTYYLESAVPLHLAALAVSGKVTGPGTAAVYLDNEQGTRLLVFNNIKKASSRINRITGSVPNAVTGLGFSNRGVSGLSVTGNALPSKQSPPSLRISKGNLIPDFELLPPKYLAIEGVFSHSCSDSCILSSSAFTRNRFRLDFLVEPGTTLEINELIYTTFEND